MRPNTWNGFVSGNAEFISSNVTISGHRGLINISSLSEATSFRLASPGRMNRPKILKV